MDFSDILENITGALDRMRDAMVFLLRTYTKTVIAVSLVLFTGVVWWGQSGFSLQLGKSKAACEFQFCFGNTAWSPVTCQCEPIGAGVTPTASPVTTKVNPHAYCDYATNTFLTKGSEDWNDPAYSAVGGSCTPGSCRLWSGSGTSWSPTGTPANVPACEPLSQLPGVITEYTDVPLNPPPTAIPDCFIINDTFGTRDPNFTTFHDNSVPVVLADNPAAKIVRYKAFVVNNCPWKVHLVFQADASNKANTAVGAGKRDFAPTPDPFKIDMPNGFDIPSCWNNGGARPQNCARYVSIEYNLTAFTCGSVGATARWVHFTTAGGGTAGGIGGQWLFTTGLNYGRDCTGSASERSPGGSSSGGTPGTGTTCTTAPKAATLTVQCGTTQNVLTWTKETNACANSVLRGVDGGNASFITDAAITATSTTYTDRNIQAGHSYAYRVKNHPSVNSNTVICRDGVIIGTSPAPTAGATPSTVPSSPTPTTTLIVSTPGSTPGATPPGATPTTTLIVGTPAPTVIAGVPTPISPGGATTGCGADGSGGDLDCDGVPNQTECTNYTGPQDMPTCPDTDGDGVRDILDIDSDNDGIPDGQDPNRLVPNIGGVAGGVGGVQTGPGEATLLAFIVSAVVSLAYVSYTYSPSGRRKEIKEVAKDQGPMDFRS